LNSIVKLGESLPKKGACDVGNIGEMFGLGCHSKVDKLLCKQPETLALSQQ
jgi:hypothetical protein